MVQHQLLDEQDVIQEEDEEELLQSQQNLQRHPQPQIDVEGDDENREDDEEDQEENAHHTLQPQLQQHQQLLEIPNFSEEYLNQLSEEQLEQLLHQQQQLLFIQQQTQNQPSSTKAKSSRSRSGKKPASSARPKSAKPVSNFRTLKPPPSKTLTGSNGFNAYVAKPQNSIKKLIPATRVAKKKKVTQRKGMTQAQQQDLMG